MMIFYSTELVTLILKLTLWFRSSVLLNWKGLWNMQGFELKDVLLQHLHLNHCCPPKALSFCWYCAASCFLHVTQLSVSCYIHYVVCYNSTWISFSLSFSSFWPPSSSSMFSFADEIDMLERLWLSGICHNDKIEVWCHIKFLLLLSINPTCLNPCRLERKVETCPTKSALSLRILIWPRIRHSHYLKKCSGVFVGIPSGQHYWNQFCAACLHNNYTPNKTGIQILWLRHQYAII